ncbi:hypothetical protein AB0H42_04305 [Nocardia sp. NPDC050799]|uniref:hypothetical protein n=1 Tax=Nocardia sp. NPDC050799 TaxID=3154842 RepID=UPI00340257F3
MTTEPGADDDTDQGPAPYRGYLRSGMGWSNHSEPDHPYPPHWNPSAKETTR